MISEKSWDGEISVGRVYSIGERGKKFRVVKFGRRYARRREAWRNQVVHCDYVDSGLGHKRALEFLFDAHDDGRLWVHWEKVE